MMEPEEGVYIYAALSLQRERLFPKSEPVTTQQPYYWNTASWLNSSKRIVVKIGIQEIQQEATFQWFPPISPFCFIFRL